MFSRARATHWVPVVLTFVVVTIGEGCTPPVTQSVYVSPSATPDYSAIPLSTPLSGLVVTPISSVTVNSTVAISASGGSPPYHYVLVSPSGGILNGPSFTAPSMPQLIQIDVFDSQGQSVRLSFPVTTAATNPGPTLGNPVTYDVYTNPVCNGAYCTCQNQNSAQAICSAYGKILLTAYTITDGPMGRAQCDPATGSCFVNQNPINTVCVSVTCR